MKCTKGVTLSLFALINTFIAIYLNWPEFLMGSRATIFNLIVSIVFLSLWFIFSFYYGIKRQKTYKKFLLVYWGVNIISSILIWIVSISNYSGIFLLPFAIWYGAPVYGFRFLLDGDVSNLVIVTAALGLIVNTLGYWIGLMTSKGKEQ